MKRFLRSRSAERGATLTGYALLTAGLVTVSLGAIEAVNRSSQTVLSATAASVGTPPPRLAELKGDQIAAPTEGAPEAESTPAPASSAEPEDAEGLPGIIGQMEDATVTATPNAAGKLEKAIGEINKALDELAKSPPEVETALEKLAKAVEQVDKAVDEGFPAGDAEAFNAAIADSARELARAEIDAAIARGGDQGKINKAWAHLADGKNQLSQGKWQKAIKDFVDAAEDARKS